jgi:ATP-binding cassette subfamily B (MDR/TAP) protein 1
MTTPSAASSSEVAIDEKHGAPSEMVKLPMAGLSEQEREIIERQIEAPKLDVGYFALFRYASRNEFIIMVIAVIASIAAGAVMPLMTVCLAFFLIPSLGSLKMSSSNSLRNAFVQERNLGTTPSKPR